MDKQETSNDKKEEEDEDNWELPDDAFPYWFLNLSSFLFFFFFLIKIFFLPLGFIFLLERLTVNAIMCFWFVNTYCPSLLH